MLHIETQQNTRRFFTEKLPRDPNEATRYVNAQLSIVNCQLSIARQVHGDTVLRVAAPDEDLTGDALVTDVPGLAVAVKTADCVPILLAGATAVAAVHAGWRGTALRIVQRTVEVLRDEYGCPPETLSAFIGPCVCRDCYQTGSEVPEALGASAAHLVIERDNHHYPDLRGINALWLREIGVKNVDISTKCTACEPERYWSHRVHGTERGLQLGGIWLV